MSDRRWVLLALVPPTALIGWIVTGQRGPNQLRLPFGHVVDTSTVMALTAISLSVALLCCAATRIAGLVVLGLVLVAIAGFWPIVQGNKFSGPVVVEAGTHGLHTNDVLALVPAALGAAAFVVAEQRRRTTQRASTGRNLDD